MADDLNQLANEIQMQQARGDAIRQQMQEMQNALAGIGGAIDAVTSLKKAKGDTLVPVGAGVFVSCPKPDPEEVTMSIGGNLMVKKKPEEAVKLLQEKQKKIVETMNSAQEDLQEIVRAIESLTQRANAAAMAEERNVRPSKE
ncbi:MAG: prefoldin subunit alpha [Candidatus Micrarchaeia archaeon]